MQSIQSVNRKALPDTGHGTTNWRLVTIFYSVCLSWVTIVTFGLFLAGTKLGITSVQITSLFILAFLYMPAPLFSALVAERIGKRRPLIWTMFAGFRRKLPRLLLTYVSLSIALCLAYLVFAFVFGNILNVPGAGKLVTTQAELTSNVTAIFVDISKGQGVEPTISESLNMPPLGSLYLLVLLSGLVAGITFNGLFAFGEEYGWRGFLMDELRPMGAVRANLLIGVLWGLFHAPIILLGYNFDPYRLAGIAMMVVVCIPFSFLLWRARQYTSSLLIPSMLHGAFNAFAGVFVMLLVRRNPLIALPVGLLGAAALSVVTLLFWKWSENKIADNPIVDGNAHKVG